MSAELTNKYTTSISDEDFAAVLEGCNFREEKQVRDLISRTYTPIKFNEKVSEVHHNCPGAYNYFTGFFGTEEWPDGMGQEEIQERYFAPRLSYDFNRFIRTMQICDPNAANECNTCYEYLPEGGKGTLPPLEMYKWGVKTPRQCIANMRHIKDFKMWAAKLMQGWHMTDEQIMDMFYTFVAIRTVGHKNVLQGVRDANGNVNPVANTSPQNPFGGFLYNYMEPQFPQIIDADLIVPLEFQYLEVAARYFTQFCMNNHVSVGNRGQKIYEFWYPEDWYRDEVIKNPEYFETIKEWMPALNFAGYSLDTNGKREVLGNWAMRVMPGLPRFRESTEGGLIPIDNFVNVDVEVGQRPLNNRDWLNAPFLLAMSPSPRQGKILYRPDLTTSAEGFPIKPITGRSGWDIRNDYDKECNEDLNMPFSQKRYELGFKWTDPESAWAAIFRAKKYRLRPSNECEWADNIAPAAPNAHDCPDTTLTCHDNQRNAPSSITKTGNQAYVWCSTTTCSETLYRLKVESSPNRVDYIDFDCGDCGDTIQVGIYDADGVLVRVEAVTLVDKMPHPYHFYWVELSGALNEGECIKYIVCQDETPTSGRVLDCWDNSIDGTLATTEVRFSLDSPLNCDVGDSVTVEAFDEYDNSLGTTAGTIAEVLPGVYVISFAGDQGCEFEDGQSYLTVTCA